jgi:HSP20 family protein
MTLKALNPFSKKNVPIKRGSTDPLSILKYDIDRLFEDFWRGFDMEPFFDRGATSFSPRVDVTENDREIKVTAELPGMDEDDIEVTLNNDSLVISGEKKEEKEDRGKDYYRFERSYGSFSRTIPLPVEIEADGAEANYRKGVLTVRIPKSKKAIEEKKRIKIKAA